MRCNHLLMIVFLLTFPGWTSLWLWLDKNSKNKSFVGDISHLNFILLPETILRFKSLNWPNTMTIHLAPNYHIEFQKRMLYLILI